MNKKQLPEYVRGIIDRLDEDELHLVYNVIGERLNLYHKAKAIYAMRNFQVLDRVYFEYQGERKEGRVYKLNVKTITVMLDTGEQWKVSPEFLIKIKGPIIEAITIVSQHKNISRNDPCWCNSGKKWKRCHFPQKE